MPTKTLSFDGKGINGPDEHRSRLATFANPEAAKQYGPLFEASTDMLEALQVAETIMNEFAENSETLRYFESLYPKGDLQKELARTRAAIAKAKGDS